jgi:hypothetical protein
LAFFVGGGLGDSSLSTHSVLKSSHEFFLFKEGFVLFSADVVNTGLVLVDAGEFDLEDDSTAWFVSFFNGFFGSFDCVVDDDSLDASSKLSFS